jgi:tRNA(Ile)-lysidine synthase
MPLPLLFRLRLKNEHVDCAGRLAIANLIAIAGGRQHLPGQKQLQRLWKALEQSDGADFRHSLGRTVLERRKDVLYISRDSRDLPLPVLVEPGAQILWDDRYTIINRGRQPVTIHCGGMPGDAVADIPRRVLARAIAAAPGSTDDGIIAGGNPIDIVVCLSPYERVLPGFELRLANALATLCGRRQFPSLP